MDPELSDVYSFKKMLNGCVEQGDFFAMNPNQYISSKKLYSNGITRAIIDEYIDKASTYFHTGTYFTFHYLHRKGFNHTFEDFGFEDYFYENLLLKCSGLSTTTLGKRNVFVYGTDFSSEEAIFQMVCDALGDGGSEYVYDIAETIQCEYNLDLSSKLKKVHKPLIYNKYTEKIYRDESTYVEEVTRN